MEREAVVEVVLEEAVVGWRAGGAADIRRSGTVGRSLGGPDLEGKWVRAS